MDSFPSGGTFLEVLPETMDALPEDLCGAAFPGRNEAGAPTLRSVTDLEHLVNIFALRKNHKAVAHAVVPAMSSTPGSVDP